MQHLGGVQSLEGALGALGACPCQRRAYSVRCPCSGRGRGANRGLLFATALVPVSVSGCETRDGNLEGTHTRTHTCSQKMQVRITCTESQRVSKPSARVRNAPRLSTGPAAGLGAAECRPAALPRLEDECAATAPAHPGKTRRQEGGTARTPGQPTKPSKVATSIVHVSAFGSRGESCWSLHPLHTAPRNGQIPPRSDTLHGARQRCRVQASLKPGHPSALQ